MLGLDGNICGIVGMVIARSYKDLPQQVMYSKRSSQYSDEQLMLFRQEVFHFTSWTT